jgi:hypothetical protein
MNAALSEEIRAGRPVFPMLEVEWGSKGYEISTGRYSKGGAMLAEGPPCRGLVPAGGFGQISYGPGMKGNTLVAARTVVRVNDSDGSIQAMLESYDPSGSVARGYWVSPYLASADWEAWFVGVVDGWKIKAGVVEIMLKTDDGALVSPGPKPIFSRSEWPLASDVTIFGTVMPLVTGIHDSYKVTGRGMVPATNIKWDEEAGAFWWTASIGNLATIPRIYFDGTPKESGFTVVRGTYGSVHQTIIQCDAANVPVDSDGKPQGGTVVSFDCTGPDSAGGIAGATVTNPIAQIRAFLNNYVFRDNRSTRWLGDVSRIGSTWDGVEAYFDLYGYEGAFRVGGGESEQALSVIETTLKGRPWLKMWWSPLGQLEIAVIPFQDPSVSESDWLNATVLVADKDFVCEPGDRKEIMSGVIVPYLYSHSEAKYLGSYESHDLSVLPAEERITMELDDPFGQGRYDQN